MEKEGPDSRWEVCLALPGTRSWSPGLPLAPNPLFLDPRDTGDTWHSWRADLLSVSLSKAASLLSSPTPRPRASLSTCAPGDLRDPQDLQYSQGEGRIDVKEGSRMTGLRPAPKMRQAQKQVRRPAQRCPTSLGRCLGSVGSAAAGKRAPSWASRAEVPGRRTHAWGQRGPSPSHRDKALGVPKPPPEEYMRSWCRENKLRASLKEP